MLSFHVDFNDQTDDGQIAALLRLASRPGKAPHVGDYVALRDSEGNRCRGRVVSLSGALVYVVPDWDTWSPAEDLLKTITVFFREDANGRWQATSSDMPDLAVDGATRDEARAGALERLRDLVGGYIEPFEVDIPKIGATETTGVPSYHRFGGMELPTAS